MADQGEPVDVVFLDFSRAFEAVCHSITPKNQKDSKKVDERPHSWKKKTFSIKATAPQRKKVKNWFGLATQGIIALL